MDERLPLFPLGLVLLPGEPVPLHIFEPRYREMVALCLREDRPFGILHASEEGLAKVGTTAWIRRVVTRYEDGRLDIVVVGEARFRLESVHRDKSYLTGDVSPVEDQASGDDEAALRQRVITQHMKLVEMAGEEVRPGLYDPPPEVSFIAGRNAGFELDQKQTLLEMESEAERLTYLAEHFSDIIRRVRRAKQLHDLSRGDGHADGMPEL
ncbi:MAG: LON peptidase substrate-binding domain-containing protein [Bacteroidota bacterium]